jgi:hypothetical protein
MIGSFSLGRGGEFSFLFYSFGRTLEKKKKRESGIGNVYVSQDVSEINKCKNVDHHGFRPAANICYILSTSSFLISCLCGCDETAIFTKF